MKETDLQNQIRCALSEYGICVRLNTGVFKTTDGGSVRCGINGMPDLLLIKPDGKTAWIEVKNETGRLSDCQNRFIERLKSMGHAVGVARSVEDAVRIANAAL